MSATVVMAATVENSVDVVDMLERLSIRNIRVQGAEAWYSCPFPAHRNGDRNPSASMNLDTGVFNCFGCGAKGNVVGFVAEVEKVSYAQARIWLKEAYGAGFKEPKGSVLQEVDRILEAKPEQTVTDPEIAWPKSLIWRIDWLIAHQHPRLNYMLERGFSPKTLDAWEISYDTVSGRIAIPVYDHRSKLVGFKGRATKDEKPKYLVLGDRAGKTISTYGFYPYDIGSVVFGLHKCGPGRMVVCEGELNAIAMHDVGFNGVALGHARMTDKQWSIIRNVAEDVVLFFDPDEAGQRGMWSVVEKMWAQMPVKVVTGHDKDPVEMSIEERKYYVENAEPVLTKLLEEKLA